MAGSILITTTRSNQVRLFVDYNDSGLTTQLRIEADPGEKGQVTVTATGVAAQPVSRTVNVDSTGTIRRDSVSIPANRRWDVGLQSFDVDNDGDGIIDGTQLLPTADFPAGVEFTMDWQPDLSTR